MSAGHQYPVSDLDQYASSRGERDPEFKEHLAQEMLKLAVARRLRELRESHRLTQQELAERIGTKQPAIARLESGRVMPRLDLLVKIAAALGVELVVAFQERA